jgi:hypothetical protein
VKNFWVITGIAIVTCILFGAEAGARGPSTYVLGMPAVAWGTTEPAWLQFGGAGVVVVGAGYGFVAFTMYGAGIFFATGQIAGGLFAFGQVAVGVLFYLAQLGFGASGVGQLAIGGLVVGQGPLGFDGEKFLTRMNKDIDDLLRVWKRREKHDHDH